MLLHCPCCHARYSIDAIAQDEAARELLALRLSPAELAYLGLFRTEARSLPFDKALRLAKEVRDLGATEQLEQALADTVDSLRAKGGKPLKNHNYLKRVLESTAARTQEVSLHPSPFTIHQKSSKAVSAVSDLSRWAAGDWLRSAIAHGLAACIVRMLPRQPAADIITLTADTWHQALAGKLKIEELDAPRVSRGFELLLPTLTEWPQPKQLLDIMPKRPERTKLRHEPSAEDRAAGAAALREMQETLRGQGGITQSN